MSEREITENTVYIVERIAPTEVYGQYYMGHRNMWSSQLPQAKFYHTIHGAKCGRSYALANGEARIREINLSEGSIVASPTAPRKRRGSPSLRP